MTSLSERFAELLRRAETSEDYWLDIAITDFSRDLHARMEELDVKHKDLAERMGTSRPYITKLLSGGNFTLHTMVKLAMALDAVVRVRLEGREKRVIEREQVDEGAVLIDMTTRLSGPARVTTIMDGSDVVAASGGGVR